MSDTDSAATRFTAIVVNYNGGTMLVDAARSLFADGLPEAQLVVVDNGSRDDSLARLREAFPACRVLEQGCNSGFAQAVNRGLAEAATEFVLLFNNDARLVPGAFAALAAFFEARPQAAFLGGRLLNEDGSLQNAVAALPRLYAEVLPRALMRRLIGGSHLGRPTGETALEVESVIGALFAVRRAALRDVGPLDVDFFFFLEETEWCHRARARGWQVWHVPAARATHAQGATARRYNALARIEYQRSRLLYYRKTVPALYPLALGLLGGKAAVNALSNALLCLFGLCLSQRRRARAAMYLKVFGWYLAGRPAHVGLPDKCPMSPRK